MPKRRIDAVDDSSSSDTESEHDSQSPSGSLKDESDRVANSPSSDSKRAEYLARHQRLQKLTQTKVEQENGDSESMHWPVVLKTPKRLKVEPQSDEEYAGSASSEGDSETENTDDEEFEYDDGGFVVDSDDNVVPAYRNSSDGRRTRRRRKRNNETRSQRSRKAARTRRKSSEVEAVESDEEDFSISEGSIEEELRDLRGEKSPSRPNRNYRTRPPVDYSIPPPPTIEEVAQASARAAESAARAKSKNTRVRRLFDVRGPFGGRDVHTLFSLTRTDLESVLSENSGSDSAIKAALSAAKGAASTGTNADVDPIDVAGDVDFSMVGGLDEYIAKLKEMISLPLLYPELYEKFGITPPRGVLFHGPPGTGKTLMARALAASHKQEKVTFYMRKGADVLSKWIGESERQLRALFDEARAHQPSIIFFDEIDGLAPVRSAKQEQHHASIVSTLLALMDGMDNRGQVVVIGATNRPDSVDPALRRPGRFDREFYFPLPDYDARRRILQIHTRKWKPPVQDDFIATIAARTKGYGGADLRALTTEAALLAIQRSYPQIYSSEQKLLVSPTNVEVRWQEFVLALERVQPSTARAAGVSLSQPLPPRIEPLLRRTLSRVTHVTRSVFPVNTKEKQNAALFLSDAQFSQVQLTKCIEEGRVYRPRLLLEGTPGSGQAYLIKAIANMLEGVYVCELSPSSIFGASMGAIQPESAIVNAVSETRLRSPACILLPSISEWNAVPHLEVLLVGLLRSIVPSEKIFVVGSDEQTGVSAPVQSPLGAFFGAEAVQIQLDLSEHVLIEFMRPVMDFINRTPLDCLEAQEMVPPKHPKLAVATKDEAAEVEIKPVAEKRSRVFTEAERSELRIRSQLKLKLGVILDGFRQRYRRFRKPIIDEEKLSPLFEQPRPPDFATSSELKAKVHMKTDEKKNAENCNGDIDANEDVDVDVDVDVDADVDVGAGAATDDDDDDDMSSEEPYVTTKDNMILERATGKKYYNMDLETVEDRLWNGFYCEPQQFLEDMEMIYKDANVNGERERLHKASEMLANAQVAIDDISADKPFIAACKELHAKDAKSRLMELDESYLAPMASGAENADSRNNEEQIPPSDYVTQNGYRGDADSIVDLKEKDYSQRVSQPSAQHNLSPQENKGVGAMNPKQEQSQLEFNEKEHEFNVADHPDFVVDSNRRQLLQEELVSTAVELSLEQLEQLYASLSDIAWQHRGDWNRMGMMDAMSTHLKTLALRTI